MDLEAGMFAVERKTKIIEILNEKKKIIVPELCEIFGVSASTIRNDLRELEQEHLLKRTHGGAICYTKVSREPSPERKETHMVIQKQLIADKASTLVEDGDVIAISSGTTSLELVKRMKIKKNLTIILNDIQAALWLEENTDFVIVLLGGIVRNHYHYLVSPIKSNLLGIMNIDKAFITCNGIHAEKGITTPDIDTALNYKELVDASSKIYVLSDSSKVGSVTFAKIMDIKEVTAIITDDGLGKDDIEDLSEKTEMIIVKNKQKE